MIRKIKNNFKIVLVAFVNLLGCILTICTLGVMYVIPIDAETMHKLMEKTK